MGAGGGGGETDLRSCVNRDVIQVAGMLGPGIYCLSVTFSCSQQLVSHTLSL